MADFARIIWESDPITPNIRALPEKVHNRIHGIMLYQSAVAQSHMRKNATWTDQTGNARNGLFAEAYELGGGVRAGAEHVHGIVLYHTMPYGIYLETRWSGKYAIIVPTILEKAPDVMRSVDRMLARLS